MATFNVVGFLLGRTMAERENVTDQNAVNRIGLIGGVMGFSPVGVVLTTELARREGAAAAPATQPGAKVQVPDVVDLSVEVAKAELNNLGLQAQLAEVRSNAVPGIVVAQDPKEGTLVSAGSAVTLTVSTGDGFVKVPDVTDIPFAEAKKTIEGLNFTLVRLELKADDAFTEKVMIQVPAADEKAEPGSAVTVIVGIARDDTGQVPVPVPCVINLTFTQAVEKINEVGLVANQGEGTQGAERQVIKQTPAAGTLVVPGSSVILDTDQVD